MISMRCSILVERGADFKLIRTSGSAGVAYTRAVAPRIGTLTVDGIALRLVVTRKRVRNINARLVGDELRVSAPPRIADRELDEVVRELAAKLVRRRRAAEVNREDDALELARLVARRFPDPPVVDDAVYSTGQRARWGSYSTRSRTIRLNAALRHMPRWVLEAVVAHELAHVHHPNHSPAFWRLVRSVCPETDRARAFLEGVSWLAGRWSVLPPSERSQLAGVERGGREALYD